MLRFMEENDFLFSVKDSGWKPADLVKASLPKDDSLDWNLLFSNYFFYPIIKIVKSK